MNKLMLNDKLKQWTRLIFPYLPGVLMALGILIRARQYLSQRSFWLDESFLVLNLRDKSFAQLLEPLDYNQVAPIGFLFLEKVMVNLFGVNELALRFIPFVTSVISIWLIYLIAKKLISSNGALIVVLLFILPTGLTYYASEVKQYSLDLFFCLLNIWLYLKYANDRSKTNLLILFLAGTAAIGCSNVTIIYLAAILFTEGMGTFYNRQWLWKFLLLAISWGTVFLGYYFLFIHGHPGKSGMQNFWSRNFMPQSMEAFTWLKYTFQDLFSGDYAFNFALSNTALILIIIMIGIIGFALKNAKILSLIFLPILIHLALSYLKLYPFTGRLVLYQMPLYILLFVNGLAVLSKLFRFSNIITLILLVHILFKPVQKAIGYFIYPNYREHITATLTYIKEHQLPEDNIYVYAGSKAAFNVYRDKFFPGQENIIIGLKSVDSKEKFVNQYKSLQGRYWLIFSHEYPVDGIEFIQNDVYSQSILDTFEGEGSKTFLVQYP